MSKANVFSFLSKAASDKQLKEKIQAISTQDDLVDLGNQAGYEFSNEHVDEAFMELKQKPSFFGAITEALLHIFSPDHDDYPAVGIQPYSGEPNPEA